MTAHGALIGGCSTNWTNQRQEITRILLAASLGSAWTKQAGRAEILLARPGRANQAVVFASKTNFFEREQPDVLHCSAVVCSSSRLFWVSPRLREARSYKWGQTWVREYSGADWSDQGRWPAYRRLGRQNQTQTD